MLCTSLYAGRKQDPTTRLAADVVCSELRRKLTGDHPNNVDFRKVTQLGEIIAEEGWDEIEGVGSEPIMMRYER